MTTRQPRLLQIDHHDAAAVRAELAGGLLAQPAAIPPKYFYDALGARLFSAITELPEYYPTRTEAAIFTEHLPAMATAVCAQLPPTSTLVELGAGNCEKAARLFAPMRIGRFVAVDISVAYLKHSLDTLQREHPEMDLIGVGEDFSQRFTLPAEAGDGPNLLFYPGSSIGNFTPAEALDFLHRIRPACRGGGLLIGVDLVKDKRVLDAAYDDPLGVTAAFNRNLLLHINRVLGTDFELDDWRHVAFYDEDKSRIEMHLEAVRATTVRWPAHEHGPAAGERAFAHGERMFTEISCKWRREDFAALLSAAGYTPVDRWTDPREWFALFLARA
jgi:dimethylhistidine N-methyltransferase